MVYNSSVGAPAPRHQGQLLTLLSLARPARVVLFDCDIAPIGGPVVGQDSVTYLCSRLEAAGVWVIALTCKESSEIEHQFSARLPKRQHPHVLICASNGSEVWEVNARGNHSLRWRRLATETERTALTNAAEALRADLAGRGGLDVRVLDDHPNRRRIDLLPRWRRHDLDNSTTGSMQEEVEDCLRQGGFLGGLPEVAALAQRLAVEQGLRGARVSSDVKHIEIGLSDKRDSAAWVRRWLLDARDIPTAEVLVVGAEFGPIAGLVGSDDHLRPSLPNAAFVSVGPEPNGVPEDVLHLGGGAPQLLGLLRDQVRLHPSAAGQGQADHKRSIDPQEHWVERALALPEDPRWRFVVRGYRPASEHDVETRLAIGNGALGVRASLDQPAEGSRPRTFVAGLFAQQGAGSMVPELVSAPDWLPIRIDSGRRRSGGSNEITAHTRMLDLRRGVLLSEWKQRDADGLGTLVRSVRFASLADRALAVQVARLEADRAARLRIEAAVGVASQALVPSPGGRPTWRARRGMRSVSMRIEGQIDASVLAARPRPNNNNNGWHGWVWQAEPGEPATLVRVLALARAEDDQAAERGAQAALQRARRHGPRRLIEEHERAWAERWSASDVEVVGDDYAQRALRFAIYHLISTANPDDEKVSVGARALTGEGYLGHVFWDTDIFLLPFYTFTWPRAARAMLMYRYHTLDGARAKADRLGYRGALYAWESTDTGEETTPPYVLGADGRVIPVLCGVQEHHISADVAYAVWQYWEATQDEPFLMEAGAEIVLETARFWASRAQLGDDGAYHIREVIGPDEYHEGVDDNAYTNMMARWNIERGLEVVLLMQERHPGRWPALAERLDLSAKELGDWAAVASLMVTGLDPRSGLIEQFAGYFDLEHVDLADPQYANRTVPMEVMLGPERTRRSNVIKQADVVMLQVLLPSLFDASAHERNFRLYAERCGHGSSLSPAMHAVQAARVGNLMLAQRYFNQAAAVDLEDSMGNSSQGVHIAALGGLWQAAILGFAGMSPRPDGLSFQPRLPSGWKRMGFAVQWRGRTVRVEIDGEGHLLTASLEGSEPLSIHVSGLQVHLDPATSFTCSYEEPTGIDRDGGAP
ncbi:MAG: Maltose phosphorylase [Chloroflexi bacterium]|nr:Maltose phosphorylase [Chloroflexota bacterium]